MTTMQPPQGTAEGVSHPEIAAGTAPEADTPQSRADYYRTRCGLDAHVKPGVGRIVVIAGPVSVAAFSMPSDIGVRVKAKLAAHRIGYGPIVSHPRSNRWTFLADPAGMDLGDLTLYAQMFRARISIVPTGGEIMLPSPADLQIAYRVWNELPHNDFRPYAGKVLEIVRDCTGIRTGA
jgi:hypothetical protein